GVVIVLAPGVARNPRSHSIVLRTRPRAVVVHRADDNRARPRQNRFRIQLRRLLTLEVFHFTGIAAFEPLWIEDCFREWANGRNADKIKPQFSSLLLQVCRRHFLKASISSTGLAFRTRSFSIHPRCAVATPYGRFRRSS